MAQVLCISRSHRLKIDFIRRKLKKNFLYETRRPRALIFDVLHDLVDLYQNCSNYAPGAKNGPARRSQVLHRLI